MCMPNINAIVSLFRNVRDIGNQSLLEFSTPFEGIRPDYVNGDVCIGDFYVVTYLTLLGTTVKEKMEKNVVDSRRKLEVLLRLTKTGKPADEAYHVDVDYFVIDPANEKVQRGACVDYLEYRRITRIETDQIKLDAEAENGDYVLKVLLKHPNDTEWNVQSLHRLVVI